MRAVYAVRRRFPRYAVDRELTAILQWEDTSTLAIKGRCRTLGEGGVGAVMANQLRTGQVVSLQLSPALVVYAAVRNLNGFYHGFEFVLVRERQREAIRRLCEMVRPVALI